ncbi:uncharacterized protein BKA55DRAFT_531899 [Fusarium redolens]|uniref:Uncharacterized protein n=1 Tax=Fusarium redolens TaxID=48865 RepID=A0A9P9KVJ1_FUSRE|nr:uncharacterized protein BKA55DRAFT_531899 [Fusarium redolens]KAH7269239.1 hypothetical protein BKA55DRAFT_531899 [Fusarium redolens]
MYQACIKLKVKTRATSSIAGDIPTRGQLSEESSPSTGVRCIYQAASKDLRDIVQDPAPSRDSYITALPGPVTLANRGEMEGCRGATCQTVAYAVEAVLFGDGGIVNYPETVVYRNDAIIPVAVIMYEKFN